MSDCRSGILPATTVAHAGSDRGVGMSIKLTFEQRAELASILEVALDENTLAEAVSKLIVQRQAARADALRSVLEQKQMVTYPLREWLESQLADPPESEANGTAKEESRG